MIGFEPTTYASRTRRATKLRYIPLGLIIAINNADMQSLVLMAH